MSGKQVVLLLVTAVIVIMAWKISDEKAPQTEVARSGLLPGLLERVNDATRVSITAKDHLTVMVRADAGWLIENKDNFPATPGNVKRSLLQLAALRQVEAKTNSPERYAKLGVESLDTDDAAGTRIVVTAADDPLVDLIIGHARDAAGGNQHYVRATADTQSWLVEGELDVPADPVRWLDASIVDIDTARVREVRINAPDATPIVITKAERDDQFYQLQNIPDGMEPKSKATVSSIAAVLLDLRLNDVAAASRVDGLSPVREVEIDTFDGLRVTLDEFLLDNKPFARFGFSYDTSLVVAAADEAAEAAGTGDAEAAADATPSESAESVAEEAARLSAHTGPWVYALPSYKRRMIDRKFDSLVKATQTDES